MQRRCSFRGTAGRQICARRYGGGRGVLGLRVGEQFPRAEKAGQHWVSQSVAADVLRATGRAGAGHIRRCDPNADLAV